VCGQAMPLHCVVRVNVRQRILAVDFVKLPVVISKYAVSHYRDVTDRACDC